MKGSGKFLSLLVTGTLLLTGCTAKPAVTASSVPAASSEVPASSMTAGEQEFEAYQKKLHEGDMENLMQMLSVSDGAYTEAAFYELTERLFDDTDATLMGLVQSAYLDDVMGETDEEKARFLFAFGQYNVYDYAWYLGDEGNNEPSRALRTALENIGEEDARYFIASNILDGWNHPEGVNETASAGSS